MREGLDLRGGMRFLRAAFVLWFVTSASAAQFKAGVARIKITPEVPIWMSGFAARTQAADGVLHDLWAKALALQDNKGNLAVIVTTDLVGVPRGISELVAARIQKEHGLSRAQLLLNSSHTHCGPVLRGNLNTMYSLTGEQWQRIERYSRELTENLVTVIGAALGKVEPASADFG